MRALSGLSAKLIATIIVAILAVEVVIYLPSVANFRDDWLKERISVAAVAVRVLDVVPDVMDLPDGLGDRLLDSAGANAIAYRHEGMSQLIEHSTEPMPRNAIAIDVTQGNPPVMILGALDTLFNGGDRVLRVIGPVPGGEPGSTIEVLVEEAPLRADMLVYSRNIFILSLIVAAMTALVIFVFLSGMLIRPVRRITSNLIAFRQAPENATLVLAPKARSDEIGTLETELAAMENEIFTMLRQRRHLADLGLAVAKINHDLRNTLTSAQLLSDQVATLDDPKVQRLAPRLVHTLDKAIGFAQSVLDYGRETATPPRPQPVDLRALSDEVSFEAGLIAHPSVKLDNQLPDGIVLRVDPDQFARVLVNLMKNAREALEAAATETGTISLSFDADHEMGLCISVVDNGPGLPPRAKENLFVAFEGSARAGGTGLGLSIAREITEAHGGKLNYVETDIGTRFDICLPRSTRLM